MKILSKILCAIGFHGRRFVDNGVYRYSVVCPTCGHVRRKMIYSPVADKFIEEV